MNNFLKLNLLALLLWGLGTGQSLAVDYSGTVTGTLTWTDPGNNVFPLEDIQVQLLAAGQGEVARATTTAGGLFTFNVATFSAPNSTVQLSIRIWSVNGDQSIMAMNATNTGIRKRVVLNSGQIVWSGGANTTALGSVSSPTDGRAQCVHWANKAKVFVESEMMGTFTFPTANGKRLHIIDPPLGISNNFFMPENLKSELILQLAVPSPPVIPLAGLAAAILANPALFSDNPSLYIVNENSNGTTYHEFAHYLMWNLQGQAWLSFLDAGLSYHDARANDPSQKMAWTEGFANGFARIMESTDRNINGALLIGDENVGGNDAILRSARLTGGTILPSTQVLDHGFASEDNISRLIYDMWDGPNNLSLFGNATPSASAYNDGGADNTELTLKEILDPILANSASLPPATPVLARFGRENVLLNNIGDYVAAYVPAMTCTPPTSVNRLSKFNRIHNLSVAITDPLTETEFLNSDDIFYWSTVSTRRFKAVSNPAFTFRQLNGLDDADYKLDIFALRNKDDSYNICSPGLASATKVLSDDLQISQDPNNPPTLHINRELPNRFQSFANSWANPVSPVVNTADDDLDVKVTCGTVIEVSDNGILELGDSTEGNTAHLDFLEGSTFNLGDPSGSGRAPGKLVINDGSRLTIRAGASFFYNPGCEIYLNGPDAVLEIQGNWSIADNAIFTFTGTGHLQTALPGAVGTPNVTIGSNGSIQIRGKGKQEHLIWVVDANTQVTLPGSRPDILFSLRDGRVELGKKALMQVADCRLDLRDVLFTNDPAGNQHAGVLGRGNIANVKRCDFVGGLVGLDQDMTGANAVTTASIEQCKFVGCTVGLHIFKRSFGLVDCQFWNNGLGVHAEEVVSQNGMTGCFFGDNIGGVHVRALSSSTPNFTCISNTMIDGSTAVLLDGPVNMIVACLNISDYETAAHLMNNAFASLVGSNQSSFSTSGPTWQFTGGRLPNLASANSQFISTSGILFSGLAIPPAFTTGWNNNHWQGINNRALQTSDQNLTELGTGLPLTMNGTGLSGFVLCSAAPKTAAPAAASAASPELPFSAQVYPQPFSQMLNLRIEGLDQAATAKLQVYDLSGKQHLAQSLVLRNGELPLPGLENLAQGIYFLRLTTTQHQLSFKVMKQ